MQMNPCDGAGIADRSNQIATGALRPTSNAQTEYFATWNLNCHRTPPNRQAARSSTSELLELARLWNLRGHAA
jgi:hypothetical protein